ncbi:MAG: S8 family serine peptidase [Crocinitomicaceae bacterium]
MIQPLLKTTFLVFVLLFSFTAKTIAQNTLPLLFKSGQVDLSKNLETSKKSFESARLNSNNDNYRIIQFAQIPSTEIKKELKTAGIELLNYVPKNAYYAKISKSADWSILENSNVYSVTEIKNEYKLSKDFAAKKYNDWAVSSGNYISVNAVFFATVTKEKAQLILSKLEVQNLTINDVKIASFKVKIDQLNELFALPIFYYFEQIDPPSEPENLRETTNHRGNNLATAYTNGLKLDGTGVTVMLQDNSRLDDHIDYTGRFFNNASATNSGDHGEHCGGTIAGAGNLDPTARGMAFGAEVLVYSPTDANYNSVPNLVVNSNLTITSKSYGGGLNAGYNTIASTLDQQVRNYPSLIHVFSAGNSNNSGNTAAGGQWFNITGGHKSAKNVLAVGNVLFSDGIAGSSSRGPSEDGRIKPDICAVGTSVFSTVDPNNYDTKTGTSMACPGVAGTLAQLYQGYKELNGGQNPDAALMKGSILNTADDLGNVGPDYIYGWGRINARRAYQVIRDNQYFTDEISQGNNLQHNIIVPAGISQVKVMVYWSDYEASITASQALVNDINMTITDPTGGINLPWVLNNTANSVLLNTPAINAVDDDNNMEQIVIDNPTAGNYIVDLEGFSIPFGPQKYFVVYEYLTDDVVLTYPIGGESFDPTKTEIVRWDALHNNGTFALEYSEDNGVNWTMISNNIAANRRFFSWNVPSIVSGKVLMRITRNNSSSQSHKVFSIIDVPTGLEVLTVCPDSATLTWDPVVGATSYEVSLLGSLYMDSVGVSTTNTITIPHSSADDFWWSVKAIGPDSTIGRRAIAEYQSSGIFNCILDTDVKLYDPQFLNGRTILSCMEPDAIEIGITLVNRGTTPLSNIPVSYELNGANTTNEIYTGTIQPLDSFYYSFSTQISVSFGVNNLEIWANYPGDQNAFNDEITSVFTYSNASPETLPFFEDFESFSLCNTSSDCEIEVCQLGNNFINSANGSVDDIDWRTNEGITPSQSTGPSTDYNPGTNTGNYLYLEPSATPICALKEAHLVTPCIDLSDGGILTFAYHMYGGDMGELHVDILVNGTWINDIMPMISGNRGTFWRTEDINLNPYAGNIVNIRFRGITGDNFRSDLAIDDIKISSSLSVTENKTGDFKLFPNPSTGVIYYETDESEISKISVVDVNGKVVYSKTTYDGNGTIDLSHVSTGFYFVKILMANESIVKKILVE